MVRRWTTGLLALGLTAACGTLPERFPLPPGTWTGDLLAPGVPAAIGFLVRVPETGDALAFTAVEAMGFPAGEISGLHLMRDSIAFRWTTHRVRECGLARDSTGIWEGDCVREGASPWRLRLAPPSHRREPVGHARSLLQRRDYTWETHDATWGRAHVSMRATAGRPDPAGIAASVAGIANALDAGLELLREPTYDRPIDAFLVDGRADLDALTGRTSGSSADPLGSTVILARFGTAPTVTRHEVMHVLSVNLWGVPPEPADWAREGIATFAGGTCAGYPLHQLAASLVARREVVPLRAMLRDFRRQDDVAAYLGSGSLFQYLYETRGPAFAREAWQRGLEAALHARGETLESLEAAWLTTLTRVPGAASVDWDRIRDADGCG